MFKNIGIQANTRYKHKIVLNVNPMSPGEVAGESHPQKMHKLRKRKVAMLAIRDIRTNKRPRSCYDWRGQEFVSSIVGKNPKLVSKFQHLSGSRPPDQCL